MADNTTIEWTDATWNPITGCSVVSPGCTNCYAMRLAGTRLKHIESRKGLTRDTRAGPVWTGEVRLNRQWLHQPAQWKKPRRIFVCAHGDLFAEGVPDEWILDVFTVMAAHDRHTYQVLTKRPERMREFVSRPDLLSDIYANWYTFSGGAREVQAWPLPNVWLGVSVEDQRRADERRAAMAGLADLGWLTWVSYEPALGPVNWKGWEFARWIVSGGESGNGARPTHPDWHRSARDFCEDNGVAYLFKQWGAWAPDRPSEPDDLVDANRALIVSPSGRVTSGLMSYPPEAWIMRRIGKSAAGRLLDGREHNGFPGRQP